MNGKRRTIMKERGVSYRLAQDFNRLRELESIMVDKSKKDKSQGGRSAESRMNKTKNKRSQTEKAIQLQHTSSFLPSIRNFQIEYQGDTIYKTSETVPIRLPSQPPRTSLRPVRPTRQSDNSIRFRDADSFSIRTNTQVTQKSNDISISDFFEYRIKYSCRSQAGRNRSQEDKINQDSFIVVPNLNKRTYKHFFAVCDGHGTLGHRISQFVKLQFMRMLSKFKFSTDDFNQNYHEIITSCFKKIEKSMNKEPNLTKGLDFSGTTCTSLWFNNNFLYCANVGDSRAIIAYDGQTSRVGGNKERLLTVKQLSWDHKVDRQDEVARINSEGGEVGRINGKGPLRVWKKGENYPGLSMTRSLGDRVAHQIGVISLPEIVKYEMTRQEKILVVATDGLWEFLTNQQVIAIVSKYYDDNDIDGACKELLRQSRARWQGSCNIVDDITFLVFFFHFN